MEKTYFEDQTYEGIDYSDKPLPPGEYEYCNFNHCNFSNTDLSNINFTGCKFNGCNLTMSKLIKTGLRDISFTDCKLLGLHFDKASEFLLEVKFENCVLHLCSFYKLKLKKTSFIQTKLQEVDFTESDLTQSSFDHCDLAGSIFENTILEKADFRTASNYSIDPELNRIKKAKFSVMGVLGLLNKYDIVNEG